MPMPVKLQFIEFVTVHFAGPMPINDHDFMPTPMKDHDFMPMPIKLQFIIRPRADAYEIGPFDTADAAIEFATAHFADGWILMILRRPEDFTGWKVGPEDGEWEEVP